MSQYSDGKGPRDHGQGPHGGGRGGNRGAGWINRGQMRGRGRGGNVRGGGMGNIFNRIQPNQMPPKTPSKLKFEKEYDFDAANLEFEELR